MLFELASCSLIILDCTDAAEIGMILFYMLFSFLFFFFYWYFLNLQKALAGLRRINLEGLRWRVFDAKGQVM